MLRFGSLFAGIGGFDLGFERAGLHCAWQVEKDKYAQSILRKHWPNVSIFGDIHQCGSHNLAPVDIICGGDPCQANSAAGRSAQPSLGGEFIRIIDELRPRIVVRENPTRVRKDAPWPWWRMRSSLESLGYAVLPFRLRACCAGAFHQRDRLFLLAELADADGHGFQGWQEKEKERGSSKHAGRIHAADWFSVYAPRGIRSRHDVPHYVDRMRGLGNAVVPDVAEWIGRIIVETLCHSKS